MNILMTAFGCLRRLRLDRLCAKEIDEFINEKNRWESVCAQDELLEMSDHYLSRAQLLKRLQELNRLEPLFQNVLNRLKKEC